MTTEAPVNPLYPNFAKYLKPGSKGTMPLPISLEICALRERLLRELPVAPVTGEEAAKGEFTISAEELAAATRDAMEKYHLRNLVLAFEYLYPQYCPEDYVPLGRSENV